MKCKDAEKELPGVQISERSLLLGFSIENKIPLEQLTVEYQVHLVYRRGYQPSIIIYANGVPASVMSPKIAYRYINIGNFASESRRVMQMVGWD